MNTRTSDYAPGEDQNQGVVGQMARHEAQDDTEVVGSRVPRLDPNIVTTDPDAADNDPVAENDDMGERRYVADEQPTD